MPPPSPAVARREFSLLVRQRRRDLRLAAETVSKHLEFSRVYYSKIENSRTVLAEAKLDALAGILQFNDAGKAELKRLLDIARTTGWWVSYSSLLRSEFIEYLGLEHGADHARVYEGKVITGLLQTPAYATASAEAGPDIRLTDVPRIVEARMRRQARLEPPDPIKLDVILSETALWQHYGGPLILRDQLAHLITKANAPHSTIRIRIQPFNITPLGLTQATTIIFLDFTSPNMPTVVWRESVEHLGIDDSQKIVAPLLLSYEQLQASSLDEGDSLALIQRRIDQLDAGLD